MTITLSKTIVVILVICLAIIVVCDLLIKVLEIYQKRLVSKKTDTKYDIAIGKWDEEVNRRNKAFIVGQGRREE